MQLTELCLAPFLAKWSEKLFSIYTIEFALLFSGLAPSASRPLQITSSFGGNTLFAGLLPRRGFQVLDTAVCMSDQ